MERLRDCHGVRFEEDWFYASTFQSCESSVCTGNFAMLGTVEHRLCQCTAILKAKLRLVQSGCVRYRASLIILICNLSVLSEQCPGNA